ncbi:retinol dehydrogenase 11 [Folsomia candida]|uniref:Retinol dehydrogenase 11 n=1 Tax=Folsomia candida TaxID=158441 RepID=A0A226ECP9_FOLCA|nr:retinol dehydrogenase 11 [Folsomia candida]OXA55353.1 Retinol dehydrogenase 11 [Folsomia candida]
MGEKRPTDKSFLSDLFWTAFNFLRMYIIGLGWLWQQLVDPHRKLKDLPKRTGETAIVTGGARGIGVEVVKQLLQADMRVIIGCRDVAIGNRVIKEILASGIKTGTAECIQLDLESLQSVRMFAKAFLKLGTSLSVLVNNAAYFGPHRMTIDGFEAQLQINYLGHFLLTVLLIPALIRAGKVGKCSRVVNVTSMVSKLGNIEFDDFLMKKYYNRNVAYCNTKLMQVISSNYLNNRFLAEKLPIECYSVHPGVVRTNLFIHFQLYRILMLMLRIVGWPPSKGSDSIVYTAFSEELEGHGGKMVSNCTFVTPNPQADDALIQLRLWEMSCNLTKLEGSKQASTIVPDPFILVDIE